MSYVTDIVLVYGLCPDENNHELLSEINACIVDHRHQKFVHVEDEKLPMYWYGGSKVLQANVAIGAFNYINLPQMIEGMRSKIDFNKYECDYVQMLIQDEHNVGFGLITVWKDQSNTSIFEPFSEDNL